MGSLSIGLGSIIGSGVLFLPSLSYMRAGKSVAFSWVLMMLATLIGVFLVIRVISRSTVVSSVDEIVSFGLGDILGNSVIFLFISTVFLGMPIASLICVQYFVYLIDTPLMGYLLALAIWFLVGLILKMGIRFTGWINLVFFIGLFITTIKIFDSVGIDGHEFRNTFWKIGNLDELYGGAVTVFWAYAGFENMSFLYRYFDKPKIYLFCSVVFSILISTVLYLSIVYLVMNLIPRDSVDYNTGLLQILNYSHNDNLKILVLAFAVFAVLSNLITWSHGVLELLNKAKSIIYNRNNFSRTKVIPTILIFLLNTFVLLSVSDHTVMILVSLVSTNFLIIYMLILFAVANLVNSPTLKLITLGLIFTLSMYLVTSGKLVLYPIAIILLGAYFSIKNRVKGGYHDGR